MINENLASRFYNEIFFPYMRKHNIKNINFFKKDNAPLSFGASGNLELLIHRRYEFLSKYDTDNFNLPNKYIMGGAGLWWNEYKWCSVLNKKDTIIIRPHNKIIHCEDIN